MKCNITTAAFVFTLLSLFAADAPGGLSHRLNVTPEIKKAFHGSDAIQITGITGTSDKFQVGGRYRVTGVCRQATLKNAQLYLGNTAERGSDAIRPVQGSSLSVPLKENNTEFDITFTLLRPGILHLTVYDMNDGNKLDNAFSGIYLGDVVFKH
jgi:hypothetical protein